MFSDTLGSLTEGIEVKGPAKIDVDEGKHDLITKKA